MLHPEPEQRFTIDEALKHAWLAGDTAATQEEMNAYFGGKWEFKKLERKREDELKKREKKE
jgi:hypothetical protein